jgi:hypothetical protein
MLKAAAPQLKITPSEPKECPQYAPGSGKSIEHLGSHKRSPPWVGKARSKSNKKPRPANETPQAFQECNLCFPGSRKRMSHRGPHMKCLPIPVKTTRGSENRPNNVKLEPQLAREEFPSSRRSQIFYEEHSGRISVLGKMAESVPGKQGSFFSMPRRIAAKIARAKIKVQLGLDSQCSRSTIAITNASAEMKPSNLQRTQCKSKRGAMLCEQCNDISAKLPRHNRRWCKACAVSLGLLLKKPSHITRHDISKEQQTLCRNSCGFFGTASNDGLCSRCWVSPSLPTEESSLFGYRTGTHETITAISVVDPQYIARRSQKMNGELVESPAMRKCSAAFPTPVLVKCGSVSLNSAIANLAEVKSAAECLGQYREGDCAKCFAGSGKKHGHSGQHRTRQYPTPFTAEVVSAVKPPLVCALNHHRDEVLGGRRRTSDPPTRFFSDTNARQSQLTE